MEKTIQEKPLPTKSFFGFDWYFALTDASDAPDASAKWSAVQLPHDWAVDYPIHEGHPSCGSGGYVRTGIGWYKKTFTVPYAQGEKVSLYFEGVYMNCDVWLNGTHVGGHVYGYTSFELDITSALVSGENELLVRVNNAHQPNSRWFTGSGITRDVYLIKTQSLHIATWGTFVTTPDNQTVCLDTHILGAFDKAHVSLTTQIQDASGVVVATAKSAVPAKDDVVVHQSLTLLDAQLWDLDSPYLYTALSELHDGETLMDTYETPFGVRQIAFDNETGFSLNGRKVILQGVCLHHDGGCVGAAVPKAIWQRRLEKFKAMGVNALRASHNPPDPALLDLADTMGFVVMDEAFDEWRHMKGKEHGSNTHESRGYSEWFDSCWREDMTAMMLRDRNHPSIIMWSIGNEVAEQVTQEGWRIARALKGLCHSLDATRPITQACDQVKAEPVPAYTAFLKELDIVGVNYTDRWRERTETFYDEEKREHPNWLLLGTEDICVSGRRGDYRLQTEPSVWGRTPYFAKMLKAEKLWKFTQTRPYVMGNFMWTGIDHLGECFWPNKGSSSGVMDTCGFEKDGYYFYQSIWVKDRPVLHLCPHLNLPHAMGTVYPLICYTNCFAVELFVGGISHGTKAYEFPAQGMTRRWAHFDNPQAPITTNDLHLTWDVPYTGAEVTAIGRDVNGAELMRVTLKKADMPTRLDVQLDTDCVPGDGRSVIQIAIALKDASGIIVPDNEKEVSVAVDGGELLGMDNGDPACHEPYRSGKRMTYRGLCYAIVRAPREKGTIRVTIKADGMDAVVKYVTANDILID